MRLFGVESIIMCLICDCPEDRYMLTLGSILFNDKMKLQLRKWCFLSNFFLCS